MLRIKQEALTFDDLLLVPAHSTILPHQANTQTQLTAKLKLQVPLLSAAMDTVTESKLAIAMAQQGGMGFIHKNMSIAAQAQQVRNVKQYEAGIVQEPVVVSMDTSIEALKKLSSDYGFSSFPVVDAQGKVVGLITRRDVRLASSPNQKVLECMTPAQSLITVTPQASQAEAERLMHEHRIEKVLLIDAEFKLHGMMTLRDLEKAERYPNACKDALGRLHVGAAVTQSADLLDRVTALVEAGVDALLFDSSHGHSQGILDAIAVIRSRFPALDLIGGNVATAAGALALVDAGADAVKVGIGPGSICTTRIVTGVGVPQMTAISEVAHALKGQNIPVIADGGIRYSGDIAKALAAGASCVMMGSMFAGTEEAPGDMVLYQGRSYKAYRGMGSLGAMKDGSAARYFQKDQAQSKHVPEGIEGQVPYKGPLKDILHQMVGGIRSSMGLTGCQTILEMNTKPEFVRTTSAGMQESHVHDVSITQEAPNYRT
jgi:IMP dehydrogenase